MSPVALFALLNKVADKALAYIPDPVQKAAAQREILAMQDGAEARELAAAVELSRQQAETNTAEAASGDKYTARWRPTIGYVLAAALAFHYLINPLFLWLAAFFAPEITAPAIALDEGLWALMTGMLGLAGWRTLDKIKGV